MAFDIEITDPARDDIDAAVAFIAQDSRPEAAELQMPYRSVPHYSHRVIFRIDDETNTVYVVRVYHGARHPLTHEDIDPRDEN